MTVSVRRQWTRDDEDEWPEAADWIKEQYERLHAILADAPSGEEDGKAVDDPRPTLSAPASAEVSVART